MPLSMQDGRPGGGVVFSELQARRVVERVP